MSSSGIMLHTLHTQAYRHTCPVYMQCPISRLAIDLRLIKKQYMQIAQKYSIKVIE